MRLRILILLSSLLLWMPSYSQNVKKVSATYTYYAPETVSIEEAKRTALERAKIQAIADEFGTVVSQSTSTIVSNKNGESDTKFFSIGGSDVKGEWIETIGEPQYEIQVENHLIIVKCTVKGKIRDILQPEIELEAKVLKNGLADNFESHNFKDGDNLYVHFKSSSAGSIFIYLIQNELVYRLLPYKRNSNAAYPIEAGTDYIFFSKVSGQDNETNIDEYVLYADDVIDSVSLLILYSPNSIGESAFSGCMYDEPLFIDFSTFNNWLLKKRNRDKYSKVITFPLTITKS